MLFLLYVLDFYSQRELQIIRSKTTFHSSSRSFHSFRSIAVVTLHYIKTIYSGLSKSYFKDHYGDNYLEDNVWVCMIAEINVFSASGEML